MLKTFHDAKIPYYFQLGKGIFTPNFEQEFLRIESRLIRAIKQGTMKKDCE